MLLKTAGIFVVSAVVIAIAVDQYNKRYIARKRDRYSVKKAALFGGLLVAEVSMIYLFCTRNV